MKLKIVNKIVLLSLVFLHTGFNSNLTSKELETVHDNKENFCPFGICQGVDINSIAMIEELKSKLLNDYSASSVMPPKPFIDGDTYTGDLLISIDYFVLYSKQTGTCAVTMYAGVEKENLDRFYIRVADYLGINMSEFNKDRFNEELVHSFVGKKNKKFNGINDIFLFVSDYKMLGGHSISFEFWFDNYEECIKFQPKIGELRRSGEIREWKR